MKPINVTPWRAEKCVEFNSTEKKIHRVSLTPVWLHVLSRSNKYPLILIQILPPFSGEYQQIVINIFSKRRVKPQNITNNC